jgi:hypothetical protein
MRKYEQLRSQWVELHVLQVCKRPAMPCGILLVLHAGYKVFGSRRDLVLLLGTGCTYLFRRLVESTSIKNAGKP